MNATVRRIGTRAAQLILGCAIVLGLAVAAFLHQFYPEPPHTAYPKAHDLATAQRQDLDYFRNYFDLDRSYSIAARAEGLRLLNEYEAKAGTMSRAQFDLAISRMVALADNGHSAVYKTPLARRLNRIPCRLYHFSDGYYVVRARPACRHLLGAKVTGVEGKPIDEVVNAMYMYSNGPRNHYDQFISVFFLESPELLNAAGLASGADKTTFTVVLPGGSMQSDTVLADSADLKAPGVYSDSYLSPARIDGESVDWTPLLPHDAGLPLFLQDYSSAFQSKYWPERSMYYVQFRSNEDEPGQSIGAFVARVEQEIRRDRPRYVVLDLRLDQGGNFVSTAGLMKHITDLTDSIRHVYVLTSGWTFSAGNVNLALVKAHASRPVTIIGEPVGDRMRMWAEGRSIVLPDSRLEIGFATGLHDYRHSCWHEAGCFWTLAFFPMRVQSWMPDVRVEYTFDDYVNLRDPLLDRAVALAAGSPHVATADTAVYRWLRAYGQAWTNRDPDAMAALFSPNATYREDPFAPATVGRGKIRADWVDIAKHQEDVHFDYQLLYASSERGFAHWTASFVRLPSKEVVRLDGILMITFDAAGRCTEFREWWHRQIVGL